QCWVTWFVSVEERCCCGLIIDSSPLPAIGFTRCKMDASLVATHVASVGRLRRTYEPIKRSPLVVPPVGQCNRSNCENLARARPPISVRKSHCQRGAFASHRRARRHLFDRQSSNRRDARVPRVPRFHRKRKVCRAEGSPRSEGRIPPSVKGRR